MQTGTLNIQDAQFKPIISFLKTFDFVEFEKEKVVKKNRKDSRKEIIRVEKSHLILRDYGKTKNVI